MTRFQIAPRVPGRPRQIGAVTLSALLALAPMAALAQDSDDGASPPGESTSVSDDGTDAETLIKHADRAMYADKFSGGSDCRR